MCRHRTAPVERLADAHVVAQAEQLLVVRLFGTVTLFMHAQKIVLITLLVRTQIVLYSNVIYIYTASPALI